MSEVVEQQLKGDEANLENLVRCLERHIRRAAPVRVEIRLSSRVDRPVGHEQVRTRVSEMMRKRGCGRVPVSIREYELPLDDARGAHQLRIFPGAPQGWRRYWQVVKGLFGRSTPACVATAPAPEAAPPKSPSPAVGIDMPKAMELLDGAVERGCQLARQNLGEQPVARATILMRSPALQAALAEFLPPRAAGIDWVKQELRKHRLRMLPGMSVSCRFEPPDTRFTQLAADDDIECRLEGEEILQTTPPFTAAPFDAAPRAGGSPQLLVQVLGTRQEAFTQPFAFHVESFPVLLDRATFQRHSFGQSHGELLEWLHTDAPLTVEARPNGQLHLVAPPRIEAFTPHKFLWELAGPGAYLLPEQVLEPGRSYTLLVQRLDGTLPKAVARQVPPALRISLECKPTH